MSSRGSDTRSVAILQGLWAFIATLIIAGGAQAESRLTFDFENGDAIYETSWTTDTPERGATSLRLNAGLQEKGADVEGGALIGDFAFAEGQLYGCYDREARRLQGVWTQTSDVPACATRKGGRAYWGRYTFAFSEDGRQFEGVWSSCNEKRQYQWDGVLRFQQRGVKIDLREPLKLLEKLPSCSAPSS